MKKIYRTPDGLDDLIMTCDGEYLTGLDFLRNGETVTECGNSAEGFRQTEQWLNIYFSGRDPGFLPPLRLDGLTDFQRQVAGIMLRIPYGKTVSYGEIARGIAAERGNGRMSAQAVGGAVGRNPVCIVIPCHRVIGADGSLTGYGGGMKNKVALLKHEGVLS